MVSRDVGVRALTIELSMVMPAARSLTFRARSVGGGERSSAASDILAAIKRDSDSDFAEVHNVLTEGKKLDQHYSFAAE